MPGRVRVARSSLVEEPLVDSTRIAAPPQRPGGNAILQKVVCSPNSGNRSTAPLQRPRLATDLSEHLSGGRYRGAALWIGSRNNLFASTCPSLRIAGGHTGRQPAVYALSTRLLAISATSLVVNGMRAFVVRPQRDWIFFPNRPEQLWIVFPNRPERRTNARETEGPRGPRVDRDERDQRNVCVSPTLKMLTFASYVPLIRPKPAVEPSLRLSIFGSLMKMCV